MRIPGFIVPALENASQTAAGFPIRWHSHLGGGWVVGVEGWGWGAEGWNVGERVRWVVGNGEVR